MGTERITCGKCHRKCTGQVLSAGEKYFHNYCFTCQKCGNELGEDAFYNKDGAFYCAKDYLDNFGEQCFKCHQFLEGEVISALGNTFHLDCFTCGRCKKFFPPGENVIFDGQDYVCDNCDMGTVPLTSQQPLHQCAGCHKDIETGQALMALDQHWHPKCFTCQKCGIVLHGEYMGKDGFAFCEKDYQTEFGVICASCSGYITGKVLQAGDKHYHPQCSRCAKCGQMFGEGEEMYLQGSEIWHPQCSEMVREMERAEKERAEMEQREAERREMDEREEQGREADRRDADRRDADQRDAERREADRREAERRDAERRDADRRDAERRDAERSDAERRDADRPRDADRRDAERRDAERSDAERRDAERRDAERRDAENREAEGRESERRDAQRRDGERRDAENREAEGRESERRDAQRRDAERREAENRDAEERERQRKEMERREIEGERREAERREMEQREIERQNMERREAEKLEREHREAEKRDSEQRREKEQRERDQSEMDRREMDRKNQRGYYQGQVGTQINVNVDGPTINHTDPLPPPNFSPPGRDSPQFDDLPPPPRPEEMPKGAPAPPTRTASKGYMKTYGSLPRNASGPGYNDTSDGQMRNGFSRQRPRSYHESSYNNYEETSQSTDVTKTEQKFKSSVKLKVGKSVDDSVIGKISKTASYSSQSSPSKEYQIFSYEDLSERSFRLPRTVNRSELEKYMSGEEFQEVFKQSKDEFYAMPKWKQHDKKKALKLF